MIEQCGISRTAADSKGIGTRMDSTDTPQRARKKAAFRARPPCSCWSSAVFVLASRSPEFLPMQHIGRKIAASAAIALGLAIGFCAGMAVGVAAEITARQQGMTCKPERFKSALDVGHTVENQGATSARGVKEYVFNLRLAKDMEKALKDAGFSQTHLF